MPAWMTLLLSILSFIAKNWGEASDIVGAIGGLVSSKYPEHATNVGDVLGPVLPTDTEQTRIDADIEATKNTIEANETYGTTTE